MFGHETRSTHFCQIAVRCVLTYSTYVAIGFYMMHYGKSSGIISDNKLIHLSLCHKYYYII